MRPISFPRPKQAARAIAEQARRSAAAILLFAAVAPVAASARDAVPLAPPPPYRPMLAVSPHRSLPILVGQGMLLPMPAAIGSVFVADPSIADVQPPNARGVFVFGKKPGRTTLFALTKDGQPMMAETLVVEYDQGALQDAIEKAAPGAGVRLRRTAHGLVLTGTVPTPEAAAELAAIAARYADGGQPVLNELQVTGATQVNLRVRVAEVSRSVSRELGFDWNASFNAGSFLLGLQTAFAGSALSTTGSLTGLGSAGSTMTSLFGSVTSSHARGTLTLDAMADEGLVTLLAEPNLTTMSGEPATFLAGGEYPIPVPQGLGTVGIEYKNYGVSVAFTPTVLQNGLISLRVVPEVSELSTAGAYAISSSTTVPALITRRAETAVELSSGQSFAIGGLIQNDTENNVSKIPGLGDLPVIGALFRSTQFQRNETELVIVVTAYVVHPTDAMPALPTDYVRQTTDLERLLLGRVAAATKPRFDPERLPHLYGPAGFLFE